MQLQRHTQAIEVLQDHIEDYDATVLQFRELVAHLQRYAIVLSSVIYTCES